MGHAVGSHLPLLAGQDAQVAERLSPAKKDKTRGLVLREIGSGIVLIDTSAEQSSGAGEASALMADGGKRDPVARRRVPNILVRAAQKRARSLRGL